MALYRIYLRSRNGIAGRSEFDADDNAAAGAVARAVFDSVSDVADGFELWQGTRLCELTAAETPAVLSATLRQTIARIESALRSSEWAVSESKKLLARLEETRKE